MQGITRTGRDLRDAGDVTGHPTPRSRYPAGHSVVAASSGPATR